MAWSHNLPVDLVLVRHGESEGNIYDKMADDGKRRKLHNRHTSDYRLTDLGRVQAQRAGRIVSQQIGSFDKMYCSEYVRAVETAGHMNLPESQFQTSSVIREIQAGTERGMPEMPAFSQHKAALGGLAGGSWWKPYKGIGGESYADLSLRLRSFLDHLQETAAGLRVLVVCHAHVIRVFRSLMEDVKAPEFQSLIDWKVPNCHIRWYTRRESIGTIHIRQFKVIELNMREPLSLLQRDACFDRCERIISRPLLTVQELLTRAEAVPQILNSSDLKAEGQVSDHVPQ